jgi:hypothetical protein
LIASLAACESRSATEPAPTPAPEPVITTTRLQLDFDYVEVIKDCDGIEGDGDFRFVVVATPSFGGSVTMHNRSHTLGDGDRTEAIGRRTFSAAASNGLQVTVELRASEVDKPLIGATYNDARLNDARGARAHVHNNGVWTNLGPQSITLGSGDCRVRLRYTATQLP